MTHITIERAKLEQVLEALKTCDEDAWHSEDDFGLAKTYDENKVDQAIASCEQALAQPAQGLVKFKCTVIDDHLTDEQIADYLGDEYHHMSESELRFFRLGEAAAKEKNT
jgi:hypothetical protein